MKIALYCRISTVDQNADMQITECREYCAARKWTITAEFVDRGISGSKASRPELNTMMAAARRRQFDAVVCWSLDRLGRSVRNLSDLIGALDSSGVRFVALKQGVDTDASNAASRLLLNVLACCAEFELGLLRERTTAGVRQARLAGKTLGRPRNLFDRQLVMDQRAEGSSWRAIASLTGIPVATLRRGCTEIVCANAMVPAESKPVELVN